MINARNLTNEKFAIIKKKQTKKFGFVFLVSGSGEKKIKIKQNKIHSDTTSCLHC